MIEEYALIFDSLPQPFSILNVEYNCSRQKGHCAVTKTSDAKNGRINITDMAKVKVKPASDEDHLSIVFSESAPASHMSIVFWRIANDYTTVEMTVKYQDFTTTKRLFVIPQNFASGWAIFRIDKMIPVEEVIFKFTSKVTVGAVFPLENVSQRSFSNASVKEIISRLSRDVFRINTLYVPIISRTGITPINEPPQQPQFLAYNVNNILLKSRFQSAFFEKDSNGLTPLQKCLSKLHMLHPLLPSLFLDFAHGQNGLLEFLGLLSEGELEECSGKKHKAKQHWFGLFKDVIGEEKNASDILGEISNSFIIIPQNGKKFVKRDSHTGRHYINKGDLTDSLLDVVLTPTSRDKVIEYISTENNSCENINSNNSGSDQIPVIIIGNEGSANNKLIACLSEVEIERYSKDLEEKIREMKVDKNQKGNIRTTLSTIMSAGKDGSLNITKNMIIPGPTMKTASLGRRAKLDRLSLTPFEMSNLDVNIINRMQDQLIKSRISDAVAEQQSEAKTVTLSNGKGGDPLADIDKNLPTIKTNLSKSQRLLAVLLTLGELEYSNAKYNIYTMTSRDITGTGSNTSSLRDQTTSFRSMRTSESNITTRIASLRVSLSGNPHSQRGSSTRCDNLNAVPGPKAANESTQSARRSSVASLTDEERKPISFIQGIISEFDTTVYDNYFQQKEREIKKSIFRKNVESSSTATRFGNSNIDVINETMGEGDFDASLKLDQTQALFKLMDEMRGDKTFKSIFSRGSQSSKSEKDGMGNKIITPGCFVMIGTSVSTNNSSTSKTLTDLLIKKSVISKDTNTTKSVSRLGYVVSINRQGDKALVQTCSETNSKLLQHSWNETVPISDLSILKFDFKTLSSEGAGRKGIGMDAFYSDKSNWLKTCAYEDPTVTLGAAERVQEPLMFRCLYIHQPSIVLNQKEAILLGGFGMDSGSAKEDLKGEGAEGAQEEHEATLLALDVVVPNSTQPTGDTVLGVDTGYTSVYPVRQAVPTSAYNVLINKYEGAAAQTAAGARKGTQGSGVQGGGEVKETGDIIEGGDDLLQYMSYIYGGGASTASTASSSGTAGSLSASAGTAQSAGVGGSGNNTIATATTVMDADIFNPAFDYGFFHVAKRAFDETEETIIAGYRTDSIGKSVTFQSPFSRDIGSPEDVLLTSMVQECYLAISNSNLESHSSKTGKITRMLREVETFAEQLDIMGLVAKEDEEGAERLVELAGTLNALALDGPTYIFRKPIVRPPKYIDLESITNDFGAFVPPPAVEPTVLSDVQPSSVIGFDYSALRSFLSLLGRDRGPTAPSSNVEVRDEPDFSTDSQYARFLQQQFDNGVDAW